MDGGEHGQNFAMALPKLANSVKNAISERGEHKGEGSSRHDEKAVG